MNTDEKREILANTMIEMLGTTSLENLRIQDLCQKAKISKSTFYRLFTDKYDLSFWIYQKKTDEIVTGTPDLSCWDEWTHQDYAHILRNKDFYRSIAVYRGQNCLYDSLALYYRGNIHKFRKNKEKPLTADQEYAIYIFSLINAQVTIDWILSGCELSAQEIIHRVSLCIPECIKELYE